MNTEAPTEPTQHGCTSFAWDAATGRTTIVHYAKVPQVMIRLDDGTCLTLEEHLRRRAATANGDCEPAVIVDRPDVQ